MVFLLKSSAFDNNEVIPRKFTCDDENISPQLEWINVPINTESLVLIIDDPDAPNGIWTHWIIYNLPPYVNELKEGIELLPKPAEFGLNSAQTKKYQSPCPPDKKQHHYYFTLYALNKLLEMHHRPNKKNIEQAMHGYILSKATLIGKYSRIFNPPHPHHTPDLVDAITILDKKDVPQDIKQKAKKEIEKEMEKE